MLGKQYNTRVTNSVNIRYNNAGDIHRELSELRLSRVDTAVELEKTRQLLTTQRNINQNYRKEVPPTIINTTLYKCI